LRVPASSDDVYGRSPFERLEPTEIEQFRKVILSAKLGEHAGEVWVRCDGDA
jgi:hypothetical protein